MLGSEILLYLGYSPLKNTSKLGRSASSLKPFTNPSPLAKVHIKRLLEISKLSFSRGWNPGTGGNFSVRQDNDLCWVSASGKHKGLLTPEDFLPIQIANAEPVAPCLQKPSDETALHCAIYRSSPAAQAVLHVHTPYTVALVEQDLLLSDNEMLKVFGVKTHETNLLVPCIPNTQDMQGLGQVIIPDLNQALKVLVLAGHGVYAWGSSIDEAMYRIEALEYLCKLKHLQASKSSPAE